MSGPFDHKAKSQRHFTLAEKLAEVEREIAWRKRSYPKAVKKKRMAADVAAARIDLLRAIARDYRAAMRGSPVPPTRENAR